MLEDTEQAPSKIEIQESNIEKYITEGIIHLANGDYQTAMDYFYSKEKLEKFGYTLKDNNNVNALVIYASTIDNMTDTNRRNISNKIAKKTKRYPKEKSVSLARPIIFDIQEFEELPEKLPDELKHETALLYAEEWLHILQDTKGSLTGEKNREIDVAKYLQENNIKLTDAFLDRYGRREALAT